MPSIRNSNLIKRFTDFFKLKTGDFLSPEAGRMLVPVITEPIPKNIIQIIDVLANDSDKTFTVPSGRQWKFLFGFAQLTTSAQAGNRSVRFDVLDTDGNLVHIIDSLNVQVASTTEFYNFGQYGDVAESRASSHLIPLPVNLILLEGFSIRIADVAAIDAAVDDLSVRFMVEEIDLTGE